MVGPVLTILTREPITDEIREAILAETRAIVGDLELGAVGFNFYWNHYPGILCFGAEMGEALNPDRPSDTPIGFVPKGEFTLIGMSSKDEAHKALAILASDLASHTHGVIELDAAWMPEFDPRLQYPDLTQSKEWIWAEPYLNYVTPSLLRDWSARPKFRLPK